MIDDNIRAYYDKGREQERLTRGGGTLELIRTQELLRRYLPAPPADVIDVGGGPGTYGAWLAREGYRIHLIDPVPLHVEQAIAASTAQPDHPFRRQLAMRAIWRRPMRHTMPCCSSARSTT